MRQINICHFHYYHSIQLRLQQNSLNAIKRLDKHILFTLHFLTHNYMFASIQNFLLFVSIKVWLNPWINPLILSSISTEFQAKSMNKLEALVPDVTYHNIGRCYKTLVGIPFYDDQNTFMSQIILFCNLEVCKFRHMQLGKGIRPMLLKINCSNLCWNRDCGDCGVFSVLYLSLCWFWKRQISQCKQNWAERKN